MNVRSGKNVCDFPIVANLFTMNIYLNASHRQSTQKPINICWKDHEGASQRIYNLKKRNSCKIQNNNVITQSHRVLKSLNKYNYCNELLKYF